MKLENRIAIVTGGARGIGLAIARRFAAAGARVTIADILDEEGRAAAKASGLDYLHCDVARSADVAATVAAVARKHGAIDILVNNAAINLSGDLLEIPEADYDRVLGVNLKGAFLMLQSVARHMVAQADGGRKPGAIINMSSVNDTLAIPTIATYCMSKGGIAQLTAAASIRLAAHGIRVNAIGPGSIRTDMLTSVVSDPAAMARVLSRTPLGRPGEPEEIAAIALFLASDEASYVTGQTIYADGGRMPLNYTVPPLGSSGPA
jgi:NAD(P)-dependent dehydrogenase (short-subunit alcohol dehydrogenase family)